MNYLFIHPSLRTIYLFIDINHLSRNGMACADIRNSSKQSAYTRTIWTNRKASINNIASLRHNNWSNDRCFRWIPFWSWNWVRGGAPLWRRLTWMHCLPCWTKKHPSLSRYVHIAPNIYCHPSALILSQSSDDNRWIKACWTEIKRKNSQKDTKSISIPRSWP